MYGVVAHFDQNTELYLKQVWQELSEKDISKYAEEVRNRRPHITIASYDSNLNIEEFISCFNHFYESKGKLQIKLSILGTFLKTGALFLSPVPSKELLIFHNNHHTNFSKFFTNADTLCLPQNWIPHCTIANRLNEEKLKEALIYCTNRIETITAQIAEISIIRLEYQNHKCVAASTIHTKFLN